MNVISISPGSWICSRCHFNINFFNLNSNEVKLLQWWMIEPLNQIMNPLCHPDPGLNKTLAILISSFWMLIWNFSLSKKNWFPSFNPFFVNVFIIVSILFCIVAPFLGPGLFVFYSLVYNPVTSVNIAWSWSQ